MDDKDVIDRINGLAHEEHELFEKESRGEASSRERARMHEIEVQLDQLYDLLTICGAPLTMTADWFSLAANLAGQHRLS